MSVPPGVGGRAWRVDLRHQRSHLAQRTTDKAGYGGGEVVDADVNCRERCLVALKVVSDQRPSLFAGLRQSRSGMVMSGLSNDGQKGGAVNVRSDSRASRRAL